MKTRSLTVMVMLLDLKAVALDLMRTKHRNPGLLNLYTFIDIFASLSNKGKKNNSDIFQTYLTEYAVMSKWKLYTPYDLWSARSSLLHAYSPFGHHTNKENNAAKTIFYYSWPEKESEVKEALEKRGYTNFLLLNTTEIKHVAIDAFNTFHRKITDDPEFEELFIANSEHFLPSLQNMRFEDELSQIHEIAQPDSA